MQRMTLSMVQILMYDVEVPLSVRVALRRATCTTSPAMREAWLDVAASSLVREAKLDRADALELVGLAEVDDVELDGVEVEVSRRSRGGRFDDTAPYSRV